MLHVNVSAIDKSFFGTAWHWLRNPASSFLCAAFSGIDALENCFRRLREMRGLSLVTAMSLCISVQGALFSTRAAAAEVVIGSTRQPLVVQRAAIWSSPQIPICWENATGNVQERGWVQQAIARTWEAASAVRFTGWGQCAANASGIHLQIADEWPRAKALGSELNKMTNGVVLNFTFMNWKTDCQKNLQFCIESIAVHEFGHALGMAHEHNRSDRFDCKEAHQGTDGDYNVTAYDTKSIMNYCNPKWNGDGQLSELDKFGVNVLYGKGTAPILGVSPSIAYYEVPGSKQLETLYVTPSGQLGLTWKANNGAWKGPVYLSEPNLLPRNAKISLANYPLNNQLEAFYVGNDGAIHLTWKTNNGNWAQPVAITGPNVTRPGGDLSAVYYPPNRQLEVLYFGNDGKLNVVWKAQNGRWNAPIGISPPNLAPPGAGISAAFYPLNNQLEGLFVGNDGAVHVAWKANNGNWQNPATISSANLAPAGAAVSLAFYPPNSQFEAFFVDNRGAVNVIWKANNGAWNKPIGISPAAFGVPGKAIVSAFQPLNNQLEVATVGANGAINLLWKENNSAWKPPVSLTAAGAATPGSNLDLQFQPLNNQMEIFFSDRANHLALVFKAQNRAWSGPFPL